MELQREQQAFAQDVAKLISYIYAQGYSITLGEAYRTKEQAEIYAKTGKGILNSLHCDRLAIDLNLFDKNDNILTLPKDYEPFGKYWQSLSPKNRWGGTFKRVDADHFERNV